MTVNETPKNGVKGSGKSASDYQIRCDWVREQLIKNPKASNKELFAGLEEKFGSSMGPSSIANIRSKLGLGRRPDRHNRPRVSKPQAQGMGRTRSRTDIAIREQRAREMFERNPDMSRGNALDILKAEFGCGLDTRRLDAIKKEARKASGSVPRSRARRTGSKKPRADVAIGDSDTEQAITAVVTMLLDEVPGLKELIVRVGEDGELDISYEAHTVVQGKVKL